MKKTNQEFGNGSGRAKTFGIKSGKGCKEK